MKGLLCLMRIQAYRFCGVNALLHGRDRRQRRRALRALGIGLLAAALVVVYSAVFACALRDAGLGAAAPQLYALAASALCAGAVLVKGPELIFGGRDTENLRAMPVSTGAIALSRMLGVLLPEMAVALLATVPAAIVCAGALGVRGAWTMALLSAFLPMIPTAAALLLGVIVARLALRMKRRALAETALSLLLLLLLLGGSVLLGTAAEPAALVRRIVGGPQALLAGLYPPADWLARAVRGDGLAAGLLIVSSLSAFGLTAAVAAARFGRIADGLTQGVRRRVRAGAMRASGPLAALYRKEARRYLSSAVYIMNTTVGLMLYLLAAGALCAAWTLWLPRLSPERALHALAGGELAWLAALLRRQAALPDMEALLRAATAALGAYLPFVPAMLAGMSVTTACSVSMEGRQLALLKAAPVRMRDWLGAKLLLSLTVCTPPVLLGGVALGLCLRLPAADTALTLLLPLAHALAMGALGLALNLRFPRLDWNQDVQAVKNGVSVLVTVLAGMLLPIGMAALAAKLGAPRIVAASCAALEAMIGAALFARLTRGRMPDVP